MLLEALSLLLTRNIPPSRLCRTEKREKRREVRAETAARLDKSIEGELLKRLQSGTYGDIYNFPLKQYEKVCMALGCQTSHSVIGAERPPNCIHLFYGW